MSDIYIVDADMMSDLDIAQAMEDMHYWRTVSDLAELIQARGYDSVMKDVRQHLSQNLQTAH